jgi:transposase-like protein
MIERKGNVIARVVPNVKQETLEPIIKANVKERSTVSTDELLSYRSLGK